VLLIVISAGAIPALVQGYRETQSEIQLGNLLIQNQTYSTAPSQTLFHRQTAAGTDAEAFGFGRASDGTIGLGQTNAGAMEATDTGFYTASFSFLKFDNPTSTGFLHTPIGDPIHTTTPVFSGLVWPQMTKTDSLLSPASGIQQTGTISGLNNTMNQTAPVGSALNETRNAAMNNLTKLEPEIKREISPGVGVEGTTNILAVTATPTPAPTVVPAGNVTNATGKVNETGAPAAKESTLLPESKTLLTKPMSRQANKPFTVSMDPDYNPRKATREEIENITGWDRFTTNVIGRSGIDSTYMNRTSYPGYINPWNVVKLADQYKVMSDSMNMTKTGSWLNPRMWAL
jgi:hypothetical protein